MIQTAFRLVIKMEDSIHQVVVVVFMLDQGMVAGFVIVFLH